MILCDNCTTQVVRPGPSDRIVHAADSARMCPEKYAVKGSQASVNDVARMSEAEFDALDPEIDGAQSEAVEPKTVALEESEPKTVALEESEPKFDTPEKPDLGFLKGPIPGDESKISAQPEGPAFTPMWEGLDRTNDPSQVPPARRAAIEWCREHPNVWVLYKPTPEQDRRKHENLVAAVRRGRAGFGEGFEATWQKPNLYFRFVGEKS